MFLPLLKRRSNKLQKELRKHSAQRRALKLAKNNLKGQLTANGKNSFPKPSSTPTIRNEDFCLKDLIVELVLTLISTIR